MRRLTFALLLLGLISVCSSQRVLSRNQWEINHPGQPLPSAEMPTPQPTNTGITGRKPLTQEFWAGNHPSLINRLQAGVVLTTVLEHDISSATSKIGDTFALRLDDGYVRNGMQVIPIGSRIVGAVTAVTPASSQKSGHAGQLQVTLQTLVTPDGVTHVPIHAFIDSNPNHAFKEAPQRRALGNDLRDYGQQVSGMMNSFTSGLGTTMRRRHQGLDFVLKNGDLVPVRLNRTLVVPEEIVKPQVAQTIPVQPNTSPTAPQPGVPGAPQAVPGLQPDVFQVPLGPATPSTIDSMPDPF